jgi:predicted nucleic acid-binding protein
VLKKDRGSPAERQALLEAFSLLEALSISLETVNLEAAMVLAEQTKLTLYDARWPLARPRARRRACHA